MRLLILVTVMILLKFSGDSHAASAATEKKQGLSDPCLSAAFKTKIAKAILSDSVKAEALNYAFKKACRIDLIDLTPTAGYLELLDLLRISREQYETAGAISSVVLKKLEGLGVVKQDIRTGKDKVEGWQLVIDAKAKADMRIRSASALASNGYLFIEAYHQLSGFPELIDERRVILDAIERTAHEILNHSDENEDGRIGWGRLWFKGADGTLLHTSTPAQNLYFGGYTYFPRVDTNGRPTCEQSWPLEEETFDHAHNVMFLLEAYLVTRDLDLSRRIIAIAGKSFDDTFAEGGSNEQQASRKWYYWKQLGKQHQPDLEKCTAGREIKNTNLRMGLALLAFSEILARNRDHLKNDPELNFDSSKYLERATQVIATNNLEIFTNNNFGYQGAYSREVELKQQLRAGRLVYDRTQIAAGLDAPLLRDLKKIIADGNKRMNQGLPEKVTICSGSATAPQVDRDIAGSCWNHLGFEAEDYFRLARFTEAWLPEQRPRLQEYLDAIARNLAAAKIIHNGRNSEYAYYFPAKAEKAVSNEVVNATYYGFFCVAKNISKKPAAAMLPEAHRQFFESLAGMCGIVPEATPETGVTWVKGYKFYELYLEADRFYVSPADWMIANNKKSWLLVDRK